MKNQSTYQRTDWSSEVKMPSGDSRAPSDTGLGGMERERQANAAQSAMEREQRESVQRQQNAMERESVQRQQNAIEREQRANAQRNAMERNQRETVQRSNMDWNGAEQGRPASGDWLTDTDALSVSDANSGVQGGEGEYAEEERLNAPMVLDGEQMNGIWPNIENNLPNDVIEAPTTMEEVYRGSMKSLLLRNIGNYVVATFLIGTQTTVSWEGVLYDVGNDYLAIYQSGRDQYIVSDLYSLKYVEFYDTRRRELCDSLLTEQQPTGNSQRM